MYVLACIVQRTAWRFFAPNSKTRKDSQMDFSHSLDGMSDLTKRILARHLRLTLFLRNPEMRAEIYGVSDDTLLRQYFMQGYIERERIARACKELQERAANSVAVDGELVSLKPST
jgi:hypothetical protein